MVILLDNLQDSLEEGLITETQALYLIYTYQGLDYPIEPNDLLELTKLKYIINGKVGKILMTEESEGLKLKGTIKPIYCNDVSSKIPAKLCSLLSMANKDTGKFRFPGDETTAEITATKYLGGEGLIAYHYLIFLYMFPVEGEYNKKWDKHFLGTFPYKGARLRVRSKGTATAFKKTVKKLDMGIFMYGTYLFIQSCVGENRAYVKSITNYFKEFEEWYSEAEDKIKKAESIDSLFKANTTKGGRLHVSI